MTTSEEARRVPLGIEVVVAFVVGAGSFAVVAVMVAVPQSGILVAVVGAACIAAVIAISRVVGIAYAAPAAIASLVAFDWFQFPPTHARAFPGSGDLATLLAYIAVAVLIGELAAHAGRRADVTEVARSELAEEQAALRRVATLVARGVSPDELFAAVAAEVGELLGVDGARVVRYAEDDEMVELAGWSAPGYGPPPPGRKKLEPTSIAGQVFRTGRAVRIDDYAAIDRALPRPVDRAGARSAVGAPIVVDGRLWGAMAAWLMRPEPLSDTTEARLADFTELIATAISNTASREELARLAHEQAALRRVATLVARGAPPAEVFAATATEVCRLLGTNATALCRFEDGATATVLALETDADLDVRVGARIPLADIAHQGGMATSVDAPIVVEGRRWGVVLVASRERALPADTEQRLEAFGKLVATMIANAESRAALGRVSDQQAALRRVATLVAKEAPPAEVFAKVAEELATVFGDADCALFRDEGDGTAAAVALWGDRVSAGVRLGARVPIDGDGLIASVLRAGRPYRIGDYAAGAGTVAVRARELGIRSAVGCPIVIGGRIWGAMGAARYEAEAFPPDTETRITQFADLVATAIANAEARAEVERLAEEQAALRRIATLVAEGSSATAVFDAVAREMAALLDADQVALNRFEPSAEITVLAHRGLDVARTPVGSRVRLDGESVTVTVRRTARPARMEGYERAPGALAELARATGLRSSVGAPIVVEGRLWGIITASWKGAESPPADTEARMARFAELLDTAIANADGRDQLNASRARLLSAGDEARRRVVRDLHDGAQQRLLHTVISLKLAQQALQQGDAAAPSLVDEALVHAQQGNVELRELAHGILPSVLTHGGLPAGIDSLVARLDLPVQVDVPAERFPAETEASAYFIVAEALTNVVKHARAGRAEVSASVQDDMLHLEIRDNGIGGADPDGHGLVGIGDRATALGGWLEIESPASGGTRVTAMLPLSAAV